MGKYRDAMQRDLQIRGYSPRTQSMYLRCVRDFVHYFNRPPDELTLEHVYEFQHHVTEERKVSWSYFNTYVCALRFFYGTTLKRDWDVSHIPYKRGKRFCFSL